MRQRSRKFFGTLLFVGFVISYTAIACLIGLLLPNHVWLTVGYTLLAGFAWLVPARFIILWMQRPDTTAPSNPTHL
jgi:hypothetical protein